MQVKPIPTDLRLLIREAVELTTLGSESNGVLVHVLLFTGSIGILTRNGLELQDIRTKHIGKTRRRFGLMINTK